MTFKMIKEAPADPVLGLTEIFKKNANPNKVNLGVGIYRNEEGQSQVFDAVRQAEGILSGQNLSKDYLPIEGDAVFNQLAEEFVLGDNPERAFSCQVPGGTAALAVGARLLALAGIEHILLSDPTWPNHKQIFEAAGLNVIAYPYFDKSTFKLNLEGILNAISSAPPNSACLLQASCHNPSGIDPSTEEWAAIIEALKSRGMIPFFDNAYQGFAHHENENNTALKSLIKQSIDALIATSFSKNFGLYGERIGILTVISKDLETKNRVLTAVKPIIRAIYSNPPRHGSEIVKTILRDEKLKRNWSQELGSMRERLFLLRKSFRETLEQAIKDRDFSYIEEESGLFSFLELSKDQIHKLRDEFGIIMLENGRINLSGLNKNNINYVASSLNEV